MERIRRHRRMVRSTIVATSPAEMQRFCELLQAFVHLASHRRDLQLRGSASPPPLGFAVRLQPDPWSPGVEISLSLNAVRLSSWTHRGGAAVSQLERRPLALDLTAGFQWECLLFPDADQLAHTLLHRMETELSRSN